MEAKKFDVERFNVEDIYENVFLNLMKQEHLFRYNIARNFLTNTFNKQITTLDAACGNGYGYRYLGDLGKYIGSDVSHKALSQASKSFPMADYRQVDFAKEDLSQIFTSVDAIVSFETVEHLPNPEEFCKACYRILKNSNGYLIFSAPVVLTKDFDRYHLHDRTASQWRQMAEKAGFSIIQEKPLGFTVDFKSFATSTPNNPEQAQYLIRFLLRNPRYLFLRIWQWGILRKFIWKDRIYICSV